MYKKGLLTVSLIAIVLLLTGCSEYDNGFKTSEIQFRSEFENKFGNIDTEQDWNYATLAKVTVMTASPSILRKMAPTHRWPATAACRVRRN